MHCPYRQPAESQRDIHRHPLNNQWGASMSRAYIAWHETIPYIEMQSPTMSVTLIIPYWLEHTFRSCPLLLDSMATFEDNCERLATSKDGQLIIRHTLDQQ